MTNKVDTKEFTTADLMIALNETFPESTYDAITVVDQYDALEAYLAFNDSALTDAPDALAAYVISVFIQLLPFHTSKPVNTLVRSGLESSQQDITNN